MLHLFDMLDESIANELEVPVERFIEVIESISMMRAEVICLGIMSGEDEKIEKAKRIFNSLNKPSNDE